MGLAVKRREVELGWGVKGKTGLHEEGGLRFLWCCALSDESPGRRSKEEEEELQSAFHLLPLPAPLPSPPPPPSRYKGGALQENLWLGREEWWAWK